MAHRVKSGGMARAVVRAAGLLVPRDRRGEWCEEWEAELEVLSGLRRGAAELRAGSEEPSPGAAPPISGPYPGELRFALGAIPHAVWTRTEGWTMDGITLDLRFAWRTLRRAPGFTLVAALTLALGIGANAAVFSLVNGILFRAPPGIAQPERLVQIGRSYDRAPRWDDWSWPALELIGRESQALSGVAGYQAWSFVLGAGADAQEVSGQLVNGSYFGVLGVRPLLGRLIGPDDDVTPGAHPVVVLSYGLWQRHFGADPGVVGRTVSVGAKPYQVIGVTPASFAGPGVVGTPPEMWVPAMQIPPMGGRLPFDQWGWSWINAVGRLRDGVTFEQARASMRLVTARLREASPVNRDIRVLVARGVGLSPDAHRQARQISLLLLGIVGLVLLITCTNVANLFLARGASRATEMGVRMALGAGRGRLTRQLVTESLVLAALAIALAVPIVVSADKLLPLVFPYTLSVPVSADGKVYLFLVGVGILAGILFATAPTWTATARDIGDALRDTRLSGGRTRTRLRDTLVVTQLALSLALVTGATLLERSVLESRAADPGFDVRGLVAGEVSLGPTGRYDAASGRELFRNLLAAARRIPGVHAATLASETPIVGGHSRSTVRPADDPDNQGYEAELVVVGPRYFRTMGIPVLEGRPLRGFDDEPERVVVVNQALARMFWPGQSPVGKEILGGPDAPGWRVVGVAGDVQLRSLRSPARPTVYYPLSQMYSSVMDIHVRTVGATAGAARGLREAVAQVDPALPVSRLVDLRGAMVTSMGETRTIGYLLALFAGLALALAAVGLYGLVSFGVAQRVRELGIRIALGARPRALVGLVLGRGLALAGVGLGVGLGLSILFGRALRGLLFAVSPADLLSLGVASAVLLLTAAVAAWLPARRAARVDAVVSLKRE